MDQQTSAFIVWSHGPVDGEPDGVTIPRPQTIIASGPESAARQFAVARLDLSRMAPPNSGAGLIDVIATPIEGGVAHRYVITVTVGSAPAAP